MIDLKYLRDRYKPSLGQIVFYYDMYYYWCAALISEENLSAPMAPYLHVFFPYTSNAVRVRGKVLYDDSDPPVHGTWRYEVPRQKPESE